MGAVTRLGTQRGSAGEALYVLDPWIQTRGDGSEAQVQCAYCLRAGPPAFGPLGSRDQKEPYRVVAGLGPA